MAEPAGTTTVGTQDASFAARLRRYRAAAGLSQEALAERAGLSPNAVGALERGDRRHPYPATVRALADGLGLTDAERADLAAALPAPRAGTGQAAPAGLSIAPNLPVPPTPLFGREDDVAAAAALLVNGARWLTLTGPGGVGKTRLALQVAAQTAPHFADGAHFVSLAPISAPEMVIPTIAQAFDLRETGRSVIEQLRDHLRSRQVLLVLDNVEQVAAAASTVAALLEACPGLHILVTSRERLRLRAEQTVPVRPLALPEPDRPSSLAELAGNPAVALFVARAQAVHPSFALTAANAAAVAAICIRLDGLPLAIELAAVWVRVLSPPELLHRLEHRLDLLMGGARDQPERHQTLRAAVSWSHELLDPAEQRLFSVLGVFVGGCDLDAIEAVAATAGDMGLDALDGVASLVDKNLLVHTDAGSPDGDQEARLAMLGTIRAYALERLAASGEAAAVRRAHAGHYLALAEATEPEVTGPRQRVSLDRLDTEHDNLRAALTWALEVGEPEIALRLGAALWRFWGMRGYLSEGRRWLAAATEGNGGDPTPARVRALAGLGFVSKNLGDLTAAVRAAEEAAAVARAIADLQGLSLSLNVLGDTRLRQGEIEPAHAAFLESLACSRAANYPRGVARALSNLAEATQDRDPDAARALVTKSLGIFRDLDDLPGIAHTLGNLGGLAQRQGDLDAARGYHAEHLRIARATGTKPHIAAALQHLGAVAVLAGDADRAVAFFAESLSIWRAIGDAAGVADCIEGCGAVAAARGDIARAARLWGAARALREANHVVLLPTDRARHDQEVAAARRRSLDSAWIAAWADGATLPVDQVAAEIAADAAASAAAALTSFSQTST